MEAVWETVTPGQVHMLKPGGLRVNGQQLGRRLGSEKPRCFRTHSLKTTPVPWARPTCHRCGHSDKPVSPVTDRRGPLLLAEPAVRAAGVRQMAAAGLPEQGPVGRAAGSSCCCRPHSVRNKGSARGGRLCFS